MFQYLPFTSEARSSDSCGYRTFGLRILQIRDGSEEEVMLLPDISTDFAFVLRLAGLFTRKQLDPAQLLDVIEDLL